MAVEGGLAGWKMGMDILKEYIRMVAVKDFGWFKVTDPKTGENRWMIRTVPLSEGLVPWAEVFTYLKQIGFHGPFSLHSEYRDVDFEGLINRTKADFQYMKEILNKVKIT